jgi:cytoskeletal protein RodZ
MVTMGKKSKKSTVQNQVEPVSGKEIREQRKSKGISLDEIKDRTKIGKFTLKLIEDDMYSSLPAPVYLKSFIRQIARMIDMDPEKTANGYMKKMQESRKRK